MNETIKLENGIEIVIVRNNSPLIKVRFIIKAGSRQEKEGQYGLAHFVEHMLFNGTDKRSKSQIDKELCKIGNNFNGYTSFETTGYIINTLKEDLDDAMSIFSDMICNPSFRTVQINKERKVIIEELKMWFDDPDRRLCFAEYNTIFKGENLSNMPIGKEEDIISFKRKDFFDFHREFYNKKNLRVVFSGDISTEEAIILVEKYFNSLRDGEETKTTATKCNSNSDFFKDDLQTVNVVLSFNAGNYNETSEVGLSLLSHILSKNIWDSCRDKSLAYSAGSYDQSFSDVQLLTANGKCSPKNVNALIESMISEIISLAEERVTRTELSLAKKSIKIALSGIDESNFYVSNSGAIRELEKLHLDLNKVFVDIDNISSKHIQEMAAKILRPENVCFVVQGKKNKGIYSFSKVKEMLQR